MQTPGFWNSEYSSRNPESRLQVSLMETGIQYLESVIHGVKSRTRQADCFGFPSDGAISSAVNLV